jgi:ketosteroid isomerase-like protein
VQSAKGYNDRMKASNFVTTRAGILLGMTALTIMSIPPVHAGDGDQAVAEIRQVLQAQEEAWNRGELEAFMNGYARSDKTTFISGDEVTHGWQTVLDRYRAKYSDREKMGTLAFSELEITPLGTDAAVVLGRWQLKRAKDTPHGRFTLIFRQTPEGWRIVQDHTSAASP